MIQYDPRLHLPSAAELPDSDDTPVDNELQNLVPNLLDQVLGLLWQQRDDWFFGVDMGIYADTENPRRAIVPDGFLSLNVPRLHRPGGRPSYVLWEENGILPVLVLEVVSQNYGGEYDSKMQEYEQLEILYYVIYDPGAHQKRDGLEVYRLIEGRYERLAGEPVWMGEIGLGIGRAVGVFRGWERQWLYWFDESGERYPTPEEYERYRAALAEQQLEREQEQVERLRQRLRDAGIDPDALE
ncbi:Uma2 family endonuclease [Gloeobacter morelensis]|uniref:Uma2 family endonuclease n=1 Tax=Gloeobacter morelensis MG652769 TaxID=2781736 RepID=A0ABY3PIY6_9CYAN|nr:Uma2 family endonuclease [Gloeobacter morelensis]UFP93620.1 Uma2 family endonuclease [Gloeobacter morelensis MG652769]